jgi:truncated hemoglobin YjbI
MASLYEKLGGKAAVEIAVDKFYGRVLIDERIKHSFRTTLTDNVKRSNYLLYGNFPSIPSKTCERQDRATKVLFNTICLGTNGQF